jgi:hypothetical protein
MSRNQVNRIVVAVQGHPVRVDADTWALQVFNVTSTETEWFLHIVLVGGQSYTLTVQLGPVRNCATAARRVVRAIRKWLVVPSAFPSAVAIYTPSLIVATESEQSVNMRRVRPGGGER